MLLRSIRSISTFKPAVYTYARLLSTSSHHQLSRSLSSLSQSTFDTLSNSVSNDSEKPQITYDDDFLAAPRLPHVDCRISKAYYLDLVGTRPRSYIQYMEQKEQERLSNTASDGEGDGRKRRADGGEDGGNPEKKLKQMGRNEFKRAMKNERRERKAGNGGNDDDNGAPRKPRPDRRAKFSRPQETETRVANELAEGEEKEERRPKKKVAVLIGYCGTGYKGMQLNPPTKTIEGDLFDAFVKAGAISKANSDDPKKSSLVRCARTDKGVHAAGNVISLKLIIESPTVIEDINNQLVDQIRIWDIIPTTNGFSCYQFCDSRVYEYLIPTYCFLPPHPTSFMSKRLAKIAEEENDIEGWKDRYEDVPDFWKNVADTVRTELEQKGFSEEVIQQVLNSKAEDSEEQLPSLLDDIPKLRKKLIPQSDESPVSTGDPEDSTMPDAEEAQAPEPESKEDGDDTPAAHKYSKALSTARKLQKQIIGRAKRAFRIPPVRLQRIRKAFELYEGNHSFHNFTIQKTFKDPSSKRYIKTFKVTDPILIDNTEWLSLKVHGQSFMMHQIRKMVGMVMLTVRYGCPLSRIEEAYGRVVVPIPKAPALGLLLDHPVFDTYNKKADQHGRGHIDFEKQKVKIQEFKQKHIYDKLFMEEQKLNTFHAFLSFLDNFETTEFEYLSSRGMKALTEVHARKNGKGGKSAEEEQLDALLESEDEENVDS
ncbi:tRNA pseudouridine synthase 1 [Orbilia ellipsospora]|uniref:tRNA pseudouridine synthase 1 n=1 Tax=Orbilia ellipsospora TaxID=2528407 RepID=A0AAV9XPF7_9PEZI